MVLLIHKLDNMKNIEDKKKERLRKNHRINIISEMIVNAVNDTTNNYDAKEQVVKILKAKLTKNAYKVI